MTSPACSLASPAWHADVPAARGPGATRIRESGLGSARSRPRPLTAAAAAAAAAVRAAGAGARSGDGAPRAAAAAGVAGEVPRAAAPDAPPLRQPRPPAAAGAPPPFPRSPSSPTAAAPDGRHRPHLATVLIRMRGSFCWHQAGAVVADRCAGLSAQRACYPALKGAGEVSSSLPAHAQHLNWHQGMQAASPSSAGQGRKWQCSRFGSRRAFSARKSKSDRLGRRAQG